LNRIEGIESLIACPYVKADSRTTKNRKTAYQYIDAELASDLRGLLATKLPVVPVFDLPTKEAAKMLQADLSDTGGEQRKGTQLVSKRAASPFYDPLKPEVCSTRLAHPRRSCFASAGWDSLARSDHPRLRCSKE